ncbi:hypothetical protein [Petrimonas sp.]|uniref:hypothetical protein n=1 Tax=Petrimonas sp. TaxID=2023866 RepID=UPI003F5167A1
MDNILAYIKQSKLSFYFLIIAVYSIGFVYYITYYSYFGINIVNYISLNEVVVISLSAIIVTVVFTLILLLIEYNLVKFFFKILKKKELVFQDFISYSAFFNLITSAFLVFLTPLKILSTLFGLASYSMISYSLNNFFIEKFFKKEISATESYHLNKVQEFEKKKTEIDNYNNKNTKEYFTELRKFTKEAKKNLKELKRIQHILHEKQFSRLNKRTKNASSKINLITATILLFYILLYSINLANFEYKKVRDKIQSYRFEIIMNDNSVYTNYTDNSLKLIGETSSAFFIFDQDNKTTSTLLKNNVLIYNYSKNEK